MRGRKTSFFTHVKLDPASGCWNWTGGKCKGYGLIMHLGIRERVHRVSASLYLGFDLKSKAAVLHRCDNPSCFNPKHLYIGSQLENARDRDSRGRNGFAHRTHCKHGHPYDEKNTYHYGTSRKCIRCIRLSTQRYRKALREANEPAFN